jgi:hypothetical protein
MDSNEQAMFDAAYAAYYDAAPVRAARAEKKAIGWDSRLISPCGAMWNTSFSMLAHAVTHRERPNWRCA